VHTSGDDDGRGEAGLTRGIGDGDAVVAARGGDKAARACLVTEQGQAAEGAPRLEAAGDLQAFELERDPGAGGERRVRGFRPERGGAAMKGAIRAAAARTSSRAIIAGGD